MTAIDEPKVERTQRTGRRQPLPRQLRGGQLRGGPAREQTGPVPLPLPDDDLDFNRQDHHNPLQEVDVLKHLQPPELAGGSIAAGFFFMTASDEQKVEITH